MAKMYPAEVYSGTKSPGEIEIFKKLKDDPETKNWIVLHSLDVAHHRSQISGEIDFVIIVPSKGVLCLEVKAHNHVHTDSGLWYLGSSMSPESRSPFKQASEAMHSIKNRIIASHRELSNVVFWSAVIFPFCDFSSSSDEWHPWQVINNKQFTSKSIGELVLDVLNNARLYLSTHPNAGWFNNNSKAPDITQCHRICQMLRPDFEFFESPKSRLKRRDEELKTYTEEQYEALDSMETNARVIYKGPAGTGKTLLALEAVRRSNGRGNKVLFCCFNRMLGYWIREQTASFLPLESVGTLHSIMLIVAGINPPTSPDSTFWESSLPDKAIEKLMNDKEGKYKFDEIIIDEAQDLLKSSYLDFLDLALVGGLNSGKWKFFGDFEKQAIYSSSSEEISTHLQRFASNPSYSLRINCRNTPRIAGYVHFLGGLKPPYTRIRRPDNQIEPEIIPYKNDNQQRELLESTIKKILNEGFTTKEIIVLSPRSDHDSIASTINSNAFSLCPSRQKRYDDEIGFCSIQAFKGLEAPVIVVTDIEEIEAEKSAALFYVAITRSLDRLIILVNNQARIEMINILTKPA
jgi:hypothetical protein